MPFDNKEILEGLEGLEENDTLTNYILGYGENSYSSYQGLKKFLHDIDSKIIHPKLIWENLNGVHFASILITIGRIYEFNKRERNEILAEFKKACFRENNILHIFIIEAQKSLKIFCTKDIADCCNSLSNMTVGNYTIAKNNIIKNFIFACCNQFVNQKMLEQATTEELSQVLTAIASFALRGNRITINSKKIIEQFVKEGNLKKAKPQELSIVANDIERLRLEDETENLEIIINQFVQVHVLRIATFSSLANICNAIVSFRIANQINNLKIIINRSVQRSVLSEAKPKELCKLIIAIKEFELMDEINNLKILISKFYERSVLMDATTDELTIVNNIAESINSRESQAAELLTTAYVQPVIYTYAQPVVYAGIAGYMYMNRLVCFMYNTNIPVPFQNINSTESESQQFHQDTIDYDSSRPWLHF